LSRRDGLRTPAADAPGKGGVVYRYLFGPVPSRRFGRSLGVDLLPGKICTFDCPFCEVGRTKILTLERREYVPTGDVISELEVWARSGEKADFITLAGSGEPTLHTGFGRVLAAARGLQVARTALLTNGSLLELADVRSDAALADVVKVAFSAGDAPTARRVNRPHAGLSVERLSAGIGAFRREFDGELWIEVFVAAGLNDDPDVLRPVAEQVARWKPDRVHLNTVDRPPADRGVTAPPRARLLELAALFDPPAELVCAAGSGSSGGACADDDRIVRMLARRPSSPADVARAFGMALAESERRLADLRDRGEVVAEPAPDGIRYRGRVLP
jgi:wyosine [tRNA(Phe)-imidazoG37] synthetase (radical SAM superfamily)